MRKVIFFALIIFRCSLMSGQDPFIETIEKVKLSIVPVSCSTWPDNEGHVSIKEIQGTGFFLNYEGDFITAAHVITERFKWNKRGEPTLDDCLPVVYVPNPAWPSIRWFQFGKCVVDNALDVAVCKTLSNPFSETGLHISRLHLNSVIPSDGTPVAFTGFPQFIAIPVTSRANVAGAGEFHKGQPDIVIDKTVWHGVSGGPLYLADGTVVGIVVKTGEGVWFGMGFARQTSSFMKFLTDNKIVIWQEEQTKKKK